MLDSEYMLHILEDASESSDFPLGETKKIDLTGFDALRCLSEDQGFKAPPLFTERCVLYKTELYVYETGLVEKDHPEGQEPQKPLENEKWIQGTASLIINDQVCQDSGKREINIRRHPGLRDLDIPGLNYCLTIQHLMFISDHTLLIKYSSCSDKRAHWALVGLDGRARPIPIQLDRELNRALQLESSSGGVSVTSTWTFDSMTKIVFSGK